VSVKPDLDYIKRLLDIADNHPKPEFDIRDLVKAGPSDDDALKFHLRLANDQDLIEVAGRGRGIGIVVDAYLGSSSTKVFLDPVPLRLTAKGTTSPLIFGTP